MEPAAQSTTSRGSVSSLTAPSTSPWVSRPSARASVTSTDGWYAASTSASQARHSSAWRSR